MRHFAVIGTLSLGHIRFKFGQGRVYGAEVLSSEHSRKILGTVLVFEESKTRPLSGQHCESVFRSRALVCESDRIYRTRFVCIL
jgi:hypothetical protein